MACNSRSSAAVGDTLRVVRVMSWIFGRSSSAEIRRLRHTKMGRRAGKTYFTGDGEKIKTIRA